MSINRGMNKEDVVYIQWNITQPLKSYNLFAATWIYLESAILSQVSQTEKEILYNIPNMWNLKRNNTNELTYKTDTQT